MVKNKKTRAMLKWLFYVVLAVLLFCFQVSPTRIPLFSDIIYLLPFVVAISCFESITTSVTFGVICGFLWDYSTQRHFGFHALLLLVLCTVVFLVMKLYVRPVFLSVTAAIVASILVYCIVDFFFFFVLKGYDSLFSLFVSQYVPIFLKSSVLGALLGFVVMKIYKLSPIKARFDM